MQDLEFCRQLLGLEDPWHVEGVEVDVASKRLDIILGFDAPKKSRVGHFDVTRSFAASKNRCTNCEAILPRTNDVQRMTLRHLPVAGLRTYLRLPAPGSVECSHAGCPCRQVWGEVGLKVTYELQALVVDALEQCRSIQVASRLTGVSAEEVRAIAERCGVGGQTDAAPDHPSVGAPEQVIDVADTSEVPPEDHPVWPRLIEGKLKLRGERVALNLLLQRVRQAIKQKPAPEVEVAGIRALRKYFIKLRSLHEADLRHMRGETGAAQSVTIRRQTGLVPAEDRPCWRALVRGELHVQTRYVALSMMVERVRRLVQAKHRSEDEQAGITILRRFFVKHARKLGDEIEQLHNPRGRPEPLAELPSVEHPAWGQIIDGNIDIETESVSLQMLLKRIRVSMIRDPSDQNRRKAEEVLRRYFAKNRNRHTKVLTHLFGGEMAA